MLDKDLFSPNGSNGSSPENVETDAGKLEIGGDTFDYRINGDEIEVSIPDDYPEEKIPELEKRVDEFKSTLASTKKKAHEANQTLAEVKRLEKELKDKLAALETAKPKAQQPKTDDADLLECFGVDSWEDVQVLQVENPAQYYKGLATYNAKKSTEAAMQNLRTEGVLAVIKSEGYNPYEVKAFAEAQGITRLDVAFDYYKRVNEKPKGESLADIQKKSVKFVPRSTGDGRTQKKVQSLKEMYDEIKT